MNISKRQKRLLSRFLERWGELTINEYSSSWVTLIQLRAKGLVEYDSYSQLRDSTGLYDHCYRLKADILDDAYDIENYMAKRNNRSFNKYKRSSKTCAACGGPHSMLKCPNKDAF